MPTQFCWRGDCRIFNIDLSVSLKTKNKTDFVNKKEAILFLDQILSVLEQEH